MNNFRVVISNQRVAPYKLGEVDHLQVKVVLNNNEKVSYIEGAHIDLFLNVDGGTFNICSTGITNEKGIAYLTYNTISVSETISNCLGYVRVVIDSEEYISNTVRFNFIGEAIVIVRALTLYPANLVLYNQGIILM